MAKSVEPIDLGDLNDDQRREIINSRQRFSSWRTAKERLASYRGSLVWHSAKGNDYLVRSYYDSAGIRRQKTEGVKGADTTATKAEWDRAREIAKLNFASLDEALKRQSVINRALGLGRAPVIAAKILRVLDAAGTLGRGIRVAGTNAIYAYEAAAGVTVDAAVTATGDIDLLRDARRRLTIVLDHGVDNDGLLSVLRRADASFVRQDQTISATNRNGYAVDLIMPEPNPTWASAKHSPRSPGDLRPVQIDGLKWLENSPPFETIAIDERGMPFRIVTSDPRIFAAHKLWLSTQPGRDPVKRVRDRAQAAVVARIVSGFFPHLPYRDADLRMVPRGVFEAARPLFES